jgi:CubicO group peptidase (beta-lactamase class C family)
LPTITRELLDHALEYVDRWAGYRQRTLRLPGIAIGVAWQGDVLLARGYGCADLEGQAPMTADHVFRIASHSKTFTGTCVMQLAEDGALGLDDRLSRWLDWAPDGEGQLGRVTVRQLLSHSAGVVRDGDDGGFWQLERDFPDRDEFIERVTRLPVVFAPNIQFKYSNFGYTLLGLVVEAVTGTPYNQHVAASVVAPLGLERTGPELDDVARRHLATGYSSDRAGLERLPIAHIDTHAMSSATGFYSTVRDLCRYGTAHSLGTGELLSDESKREMQRDAWSVDGDEEHYGLGFGIQRVGGRRVVGHGGGFPGFITATRIDPEERLVVTALTNASDGPAADLAHGVIKIVNRAVAAPAEARADGHPGVDRARFAGRFWSLGGPLDVVRFGSELLALDPELADPLGEVTELRVEGPDRLTIAKTRNYGSPGEGMRYTFDGDGGGVSEVRAGAATLRPWEAFERVTLTPLRETRRAAQREPLAL